MAKVNLNFKNNTLPKVLIACEYSGVVREAFNKQNFEVWSCDLLPSEIEGGNHYQGNVFDILHLDWDLMIAHPPCTHLCVSGARHFKNKLKEQNEALEFFYALCENQIPRICVENPVGIVSTRYKPPTQYIHPYYFGDPASKKTGLWLKNLPKLEPTNIVIPNKIKTKSGKIYDEWWYKTSLVPYKDRGKVRSKTFQGIADAMVHQWGPLLSV